VENSLAASPALKGTLWLHVFRSGSDSSFNPAQLWHSCIDESGKGTWLFSTFWIGGNMYGRWKLLWNFGMFFVVVTVLGIVLLTAATQR